MIFEVGKTYQHNAGERMTIIGRLKTHMYGECLIGELDNGELIAAGESEEHTVNWHECPYTAGSEEKCEKCEYYHNPDYTRCQECKAKSEDKK